jgi:predicted  nucleic acid-binding Zn-ribbon protein
MRFCFNCKKITESGDGHCGACNSRLKEIDENQSVCFICGEIYDDGKNYMFCAKCGGKLEKPRKDDKIERKAAKIDAARLAAATEIASLKDLDLRPEVLARREPVMTVKNAAISATEQTIGTTAAKDSAGVPIKITETVYGAVKTTINNKTDMANAVLRKGKKAEKVAAKENKKAEKAVAKENKKAEKAVAKKNKKIDKIAAKENKKAEKIK